MTLIGVISFVFASILIFVPGIITIILAREKINHRIKYIMPVLALLLVAITYFDTGKNDIMSITFIYSIMQFKFLIITCILFDLFKNFKKQKIFVYLGYLMGGYFIIWFMLQKILYAIYN